MKRAFFVLLFGILCLQLFAIVGIPVQINKTGIDDGTKSAGISVELNGNTLDITFSSACGAADIVVETSSGAIVASAYCPSTPGYAEVTISTPGSYVLTITTSDGIYKGQFIIN